MVGSSGPVRRSTTTTYGDVTAAEPDTVWVTGAVGPPAASVHRMWLSPPTATAWLQAEASHVSGPKTS